MSRKDPFHFCLAYFFDKVNLPAMKTVLTRAAEIVVASVLLILLLPFFLLAVVIVQIDSPGPIIFKQVRVGKNGKSFVLYKLRTMRKNANGTYPPHTQVNDPRFSPVCRLIRSTGIDEVPQLWNVIKGDMGLVGPRPELPAVVETYNSRQKEVLKFRPGVFGISQLALREGVDYRKKLKIELAYYPKRTLMKDIMILIFTPIVLMWHTLSKILPFVKHKREFVDTFWFRYLLSATPEEVEKLLNVSEEDGKGVFETTPHVQARMAGRQG